MPLPPWVIQELEEERLRREEEERVRQSRIELPQSPLQGDNEARPVPGGVSIIDISPRDADVIDI